MIITFEALKKVFLGPNELLGANGDKEKDPFEILMECSTQKLHQFHQN